MDSDNKYGTNNIHRDLLVLLDSFNNICRHNNIEYSLYAGSMLGAVRHKGFIPWDDDADVLMTIDNYKKIKKAIVENEEYYIDEYDAWLPRFRRKDIKNGPFIDIFWLTNAPNSNILFKIKVFKLRILQSLLKQYKSSHKRALIYRVILSITKQIGKLFSRKALIERYNRIATKEEKQHSIYYQIPNGDFFGINNKYEKSRLSDKYIDIPFEGVRLMVLKDHSYILNIIYGSDYMTPPPENMRYGSHANQIKTD